jgi:hypothetical protein
MQFSLSDDAYAAWAATYPGPADALERGVCLCAPPRPDGYAIQMLESTDSLGTAYVTGQVVDASGVEVFYAAGPDWHRVHQQCVDWWDAHGPSPAR